MIETTTPTPVSSMRLLCHVRMFKPQFAKMVESGFKCQTVRPIPKRMPKAGDRISLRMWTGKPYRSKQRVLLESTITEVSHVSINNAGVIVGDGYDSSDAFALADGFPCFAAMLNWFEEQHGLPFAGIVIKWHNAPDQRPPI